MTATATLTRATLSVERADLLETINKHRHFLRHTVQGLTDEQATRRTTVSELTLAGLVKHVIHGELDWVRFILEGPETGEPDYASWALQFQLLDGESLEGMLSWYEEVARRTDEIIATTDLDASQPLPAAPWFEPGARWSARRTILHLIAEISQHAGHADIIREALDGQKSMG
ncbi:DinB family protein [Longispora albida]|uniref:DinB family protein n=1 Tax=Longispora albida TaxID=203523 RepID=UPI000382E586|nr:DinB family protein [Longispora albida]